jgi:hypothetical protein
VDNYIKPVDKRGYICYNLYMPSQHTKWSEDIRLIQALDEMRQRNMDFMSKCYFCGAKSIGIKAIAEKLYSVCSNHKNSTVDQ